MTSWTALTTSPDLDAAQALGLAIEALDPAPSAVAVLEMEDGSGLFEIGGYFTERPDGVVLDLLAAVHGARPFAVSKLDDRDWVAQVRRELSPVSAGRFIVHGGHDAGCVPLNRIGLVIEAAMAFGTGHHPTTVGCLTALDRLARRGRLRHVADIGCGTGVLALAAVRLWRIGALAGDIDAVATATARANARANRAAARLRVVTAAGFRATALQQGPRFDLVFANILARPLKRLAPDMARRVRPGGHAILSGLLTVQAPAVEAVYRSWGFVPAARLRIGEWTTLTLRRVG
jgi:ribosomal protein L11 methyltransferase